MQKLKLYIANKRYSSWSLRPWLALKVKGIAFEETLSPFDLEAGNAHFSAFSPSGKVPVLVHDGQTVWDSLAILETVNELAPDSGLWPAAAHARAHARAVANEMHAGFGALRNECPMNMARTPGKIPLSDSARKDIARIEMLYDDCLQRSGGPFLFGKFTIADAMLAPVVNRVDVYHLSAHPAVERFGAAIKALDAWQDWERDALRETRICENVEI